jgi:hypothetical protein
MDVDSDGLFDDALFLFPEFGREFMGVWQGVAMDSLKYLLGLPYPSMPYPSLPCGVAMDEFCASFY